MSALDEAIALADYLEKNHGSMTPQEIKETNDRLMRLTLQAQREQLEAERKRLLSN